MDLMERTWGNVQDEPTFTDLEPSNQELVVTDIFEGLIYSFLEDIIKFDRQSTLLYQTLGKY